MEFECLKSDLLNAIQITQKAVSSKNIIPVLSGILLQTKENQLFLDASNLEMSIKNSFEINNKEDGSTVVPARIFFDIVKNLPESNIKLKYNNEKKQLILNCDNSEFNVNCFVMSDFPQISEEETKKEIIIEAEKIIRSVNKIIKAVSKDESRQTLTGIFVKINDDEMEMVGTDSYRLAVYKEKINKSNENIEIILPTKILDELIKILLSEKAEKISIKFMENQVIFKFKNICIFSRIIEGQFPNYNQLIPENNKINLKINRQILIDVVKRVSLFSQGNNPIKLFLKDKRITVSAVSQELGEAVEYIEVEENNIEELNIAFNSQYLLDGLQVLEDENIIFEINDSLKPALIKSENDKNYLYLTMPVRI
ncbi:MAG: DNA polymerase III subunit beta [Actinobacteria bacterium]|nr:DNA polymerase III subunit beta [Actinomycetota bacterium]